MKPTVQVIHPQGGGQICIHAHTLPAHRAMGWIPVDELKDEEVKKMQASETTPEVVKTETTPKVEQTKTEE